MLNEKIEKTLDEMVRTCRGNEIWLCAGCDSVERCIRQAQAQGAI